MAFRGADGALSLSPGRAERFTRDIWLRRAAQREAAPWPEAGRTSGRTGRVAGLPGAVSMRCDGIGCIYRKGGRTLALELAADALAEDCRMADVVLSRVPVRRGCEAMVVIDRFDLWRDGGHAVWLGKDGAIRVESVNGRRGHRPWVLRPEGSVAAGSP